MIRMGYVYGNLMVNVQPRNEKLVARARRIVAQAAGLAEDRAAQLLTEAGGVVKTAILMGKLGLDRSAAEARLAATRGRLTEALR